MKMHCVFKYYKRSKFDMLTDVTDLIICKVQSKL